MFCPNCGTQIDENGAFCPNCGSQLNSVETTTPAATVAEKPKKKKGAKIVLIICSLVLVVAIVLGALWFLNGKGKGKDNDDSSTPSTETSQEIPDEETIEYIDYYANADKWAGEYGFSDLAQFTYYSNNVLQSVSEEHLGVISAFEYDCDNDSHNELITLSLLPTTDGKLYLSPAMFTNKNEIVKLNSLTYSMNKLKSDIPVLEIGSINNVWDGYVTTRVFIDENKLCVLYGMYSSAEIGRGEMYDNIYVYEMSSTGLNLYRHYYCYEEEVTTDIRSCSVGETVTNKTRVLNMNYDSGTPDWLSLNEQEKEQWKSMVKQAVSEMRSDASSFGFDDYLASESDLENWNNYIISSKIYGDEDFRADDLILDTWFNCESGTGIYLAEEITDHTNIRTKLIDN